MFQRLRAAWRAGRAGQPMPAKADQTTGQTGAIIGIAGISILVVFSVAYGFGHAEKKRRKEEDQAVLAEDDELKTLEKDAEAAKLELRGGATVDTAEARPDVDAEEDRFPPGSAACPACNAVHLDADDAAECCPDKRGYKEEETTFQQDTETGEITDTREDDPEPDGVEDLWGDHTGGAAEEEGEEEGEEE